MKSFELSAIAGSGGGLIVDARHYKSFELQAVAEKTDSILIVRNASYYKSFECQAIAKAAPGKVVFDFVHEH